MYIIEIYLKCFFLYNVLKTIYLLVVNKVLPLQCLNNTIVINLVFYYVLSFSFLLIAFMKNLLPNNNLYKHVLTFHHIWVIIIV